MAKPPRASRRALAGAPQSLCPCEEDEVSGLVACDNEGCAGWTSAEPHAWETAHEQGYALRWLGYRQEVDRSCAGRGATGWRGSRLGQAGQRCEVGVAAGPAPYGRRAAAGDVLRGLAVRGRGGSAAGRPAGGAGHGGGAV